MPATFGFRNEGVQEREILVRIELPAEDARKPETPTPVPSQPVPEETIPRAPEESPPVPPVALRDEQSPTPEPVTPVEQTVPEPTAPRSGKKPTARPAPRPQAPVPAHLPATEQKTVPSAPIRSGSGDREPVVSPPVETVFGTEKAPRFVHQALPVYPPLALRRGKEGKVLLRLSISATGALTDVEIIEDPGFGFAEAAVTAVRNSSFEPAMGREGPVPSRAILPVSFQLR